MEEIQEMPKVNEYTDLKQIFRDKDICSLHDNNTKESLKECRTHRTKDTYKTHKFCGNDLNKLSLKTIRWPI